ncbi:MAG: hypothetical protein MUE40_07360 [Anaerolineae bacterium]|nr:hypothetical protein [Anaerolineae bacterium]
MSQNRPETMLTTCGAEHLENVLDLLDELHTAASEGTVTSLTGMNQHELLSLLREVVYLAQETMEEIQQNRAQKMPVLRLIDKVNVKAG